MTPQEPMTNAAGKRICGAKLGTRDGYCQSTILYPNNKRCRVHGGTSPSGRKSPQWKTGEYSKDLIDRLPRNLRDLAQKAIGDPNRLELQAELAVLHAMLYDSLTGWKTGGGDLWRRNAALWEQYRTARDAKDADAMTDAIVKLEALGSDGYADYRAREETRRIIQDIRRVSESERKRMIEAELTLSADQVMRLASSFATVIAEEVSDQETTYRINRRLAVMLGMHRQTQLERGVSL